MNILQAIILGIIEGLTELLPVSSTAHLMVASAIMGIQETEFVKSFLIAVQLGAVIAVTVYYLRRILNSHLLWKKVLTAFIPTAIIGFVLYDFVKGYLLENLFVVGIALVVGGIIMIIVELFVKSEDAHAPDAIAPESISYGKALAIGCIQALALIPGVSRSGATIIGGRLMKINRRALVEFSFLLAIPVIGGATFFDLVKTNAIGTSSNTTALLVVGMLVAGLVTWGVISWFIRFIERHTFVSFGVYRIVVGILVIIFITFS